jgi:FkbM family methyltransferase
MNFIDKKFYNVMQVLSKNSENAIYGVMLKAYADVINERTKLKPSIGFAALDYHKKYPFWGSVDLGNKPNFLSNRAHMLVAHREEIEKVYSRLDDYTSKFIYSSVIVSLCDTFKGFKDLGKTYDKIFDEYCDLDFFKAYEKEVFVDCGCFDGGNCIQYYQNFGNDEPDKFMFIGYEITETQIPIIEYNLKKFGITNYDIRQKAVSDRAGELRFDSSATDASANAVSQNDSSKATGEATGETAGEATGETPGEATGETAVVEAVRIDDDIKEPITFLKMDIEGAEQSAILGAKEHIKNDKPKLGLSIYHSYEDMWKIPLMIDEICPGYRFRLQSKSGDLVPTEITLLASHPDRD